jgi:hypothetical protein
MEEDAVAMREERDMHRRMAAWPHGHMEEEDGVLTPNDSTGATAAAAAATPARGPRSPPPPPPIPFLTREAFGRHGPAIVFDDHGGRVPAHRAKRPCYVAGSS